jgi:hypothetical protein
VVLLRVRDFTNRGSTTKVIGKFPSLKTGKSVWWESQIERDMIYLLEFDNRVITYREQPLRIQYFLNGKLHFYTPDFLVESGDERRLIEVKPESKATKPEMVALFHAIAYACLIAGYQFVLMTDTMIRTQPRLKNIKLLWRYSRTPLDAQHFIYCDELMSGKTNICLVDAIRFFELKGATRATVYALLYHGALGVDLFQPINPNAQLYLPGTRHSI